MSPPARGEANLDGGADSSPSSPGEPPIEISQLGPSRRCGFVMLRFKDGAQLKRPLIDVFGVRLHHALRIVRHLASGIFLLETEHLDLICDAGAIGDVRFRTRCTLGGIATQDTIEHIPFHQRHCRLVEARRAFCRAVTRSRRRRLRPQDLALPRPRTT